VLGYRLMFRMPIRNFGRYESIAINHTVVANGADGIRRWGDYSDLTVDPADDCKFFYTTEYVADDVVVIGTWRTRVVSFRFPGCK
jgi:hypothetical protein